MTCTRATCIHEELTATTRLRPSRLPTTRLIPTRVGRYAGRTTTAKSRLLVLLVRYILDKTS